MTFTKSTPSQTAKKKISIIAYNETVGFSLVGGNTKRKTILINDDGATANWNAAYGWGNHALAGYLKSSGNTNVTAHSILSSTHSDTVVDTIVYGDLFYANATPNWARFPGNTTATKKFLTETSSVPGWSTIDWADVAKAGSSIADFDTHSHATLSGIGTDDHHAQIHDLISSNHTASGLTPGYVLTAINATTFGFEASVGGLFVSVKDYGATGDGTTDDTVSIKNALDAVHAVGGGVVYFPVGTYIVNAYVHPEIATLYSGIWVYANTILMGAGIDATIIKFGDNQHDNVGVAVSVISNYELWTGFNIKIMDLTVDGNNLNQGANIAAYGLAFLYARNVIVENVKVKNILGTASSGEAEGFYFVSTLCTDTSFINCIATRDAGNSATGFANNSCTNIKYVNCIAYAIQNIAGTIGIGFTGNATYQAQYVNCHAFLNKVYGFNCELGANVCYTNCISGGTSSASDYIPKGLGTYYTSGTNFTNGTYGYSINGTIHCQIIGGLVSGHTDGIDLSGGADYITLSGVDLIGNTTPLNGTATHMFIRGCPGVNDNISHTILSDIGTTTHATIDSYLDQSVKQAASPTFVAATLTNGQVVFPAVQVPSAGANTLDDYEEGTWMAGFTCGTSGTITINNSYKTGMYTKIGRQVTVTGYFSVTSVSSPVGTLTLTGLPFTCNNSDSAYAGVALSTSTLKTTAITSIQGYVVKNTTTIVLVQFSEGVSSALAGNVQANSAFSISATYFV